jgi:hypothetical protein
MFRKMPLETPRHKWEVNIKMDIKEMEYEGVDWIKVAQDRSRWRALVNKVMKL